MKRRATIGLLLDGLSTKYQTGILTGIKEEVNHQNVNFICFPGNHINSNYDYQYMSNILYKIAGRYNVDGLIILSSTMFQFVSKQEIIKFCNSFSPLPIISVALKIPGIPSITVEAKTGIEQLISHLINFHNYKNFVYINGPVGHEEADFRFDCFKSLIEKHSIDLPEENIIQGNFLKNYGMDVLCRMIQKNRKKIDVIVAANDTMAIGAIEALYKIGINVPADLAVTGFDNITESKYVTSPLTTIHQPLKKLGKEAVISLLKLINGGNVPMESELPAKARIRQSCGCFSGRVKKIYESNFDLVNKTEEFNIVKIHKEIVTDLNNTLSYNKAKNLSHNIKKLLECLKADIGNNEFSSFITLLNDILQLSFSAKNEIYFWNEVISSIRNRFFYYYNKNFRIESIFEQAWVLIGETESRLEAFKRIQIEKYYSKLQTIGSGLLTAFDWKKLMNIIVNGVMELNFSHFFISLYETKDPCPEWSRLCLAVVDGVKIAVNSNGIKFPTKKLCPSTFLDTKKPYLLIMEALYFKQEQLGFMLIEAEPENAFVFSSLRDQISSAIKGVDLMRQIKNYSNELEKQVAKRTMELKKANIRLQEDIDKRKYLEKEIIEISGREQKRIGQDLHDDLCQSIAGISVLASALGNRMKEKNLEEAESAYQLSAMMNDTVEQTKKIVRGLYPIHLTDSMDSALTDLASIMEERYSIPIELEIEESLTIPESISIHLYRIAQEALSNALRHASADFITLSLAGVDDKIVLRIIDDGCGLPEPSEKRTGIGLDIMQYRANIIHGSLTIRRNGNKGTEVKCIINPHSKRQNSI